MYGWIYIQNDVYDILESDPLADVNSGACLACWKGPRITLCYTTLSPSRFCSRRATGQGFVTNFCHGTVKYVLDTMIFTGFVLGVLDVRVIYFKLLLCGSRQKLLNSLKYNGRYVLIFFFVSFYSSANTFINY